MALVSLLAVGSVKTSWAKDGCQQYLDRLNIDYIELPASKQKDQQKQAEEESQKIIDALSKRKGQVWVLDERGDSCTSPAFADALAALEDRGESVLFVLGGAYGLTDAVRAKADRIIRLSDMVFPHELCRIVLLEQIYRADQIRKGSGYHH